MKQTVFALSLLFLHLGLCRADEPQAVRLEKDPAVAFLLNIQETLEKVSPEYREILSKYQARLAEISSETRKLEQSWGRRSRSGPDADEQRRKIREFGRKLLSEALSETDALLLSMRTALQKNRAELENALLEEKP